MEQQPKLAFKGFDKNLQCRSIQFEIGKEYEIDNPKPNPKICSSDGFHYCNELKNVFGYYSIVDGNRYCEIEVLGNFTDNHDKSITTKFKITKEITEQVNKERNHKLLHIELVKDLQINNPLVSIGGSVALFLHGIRLKRFISQTISDIDLVAPYYTQLKSGEDSFLDEVDAKSSGNDFDACFIYNENVKIEVKICPKQRYEIIEYDGFKYKVSPLEIIMAAKWRYAMSGQTKHKHDCYEMLGKKINP